MSFHSVPREVLKTEGEAKIQPCMQSRVYLSVIYEQNRSYKNLFIDIIVQCVNLY